MSIRIPTASTNNVISRNFVKQMASDGFAPVIALEAFVEAGRTYQAYQRGGFDEARERITEEFSGAVFWLGGVTALNSLFEKLGQKFLKLPDINVSIAKDDVRKPLDNYLMHEKTKEGAKILESTMAKFKFVKVISSVVLANAFIGFVLPKINQSITRAYHRKAAEAAQSTTGVQNVQNEKEQTGNKASAPVSTDIFVKRPEMASFAPVVVQNGKDVPFKGSGNTLLSLANKFESDRNYKLLAVDAGTASGRAYSARNNDERIEILFRDLGSVFFYMFNMPLMNKWLNKLQQNGNGTRLDPVSADFYAKYVQNYLEDNNIEKLSADDYAKEFLGKDVELPKTLVDKFAGDKIKIISLDEFKGELKNLVSADKLAEFEKTAEKMSKLQPQVKGMSILTESQVKDVLSGGHINNPEFLREFYKLQFGNDFTDKYKFVAQSDLDAYKQTLTDFAKSIIDDAKKLNSGEITEKLLQKASNKNFRMNALNWGTGFAVSALFLSTIIPKLQYMITKWRTGSDNFPGTNEFREANK